MMVISCNYDGNDISINVYIQEVTLCAVLQLDGFILKQGEKVAFVASVSIAQPCLSTDSYPDTVVENVV